MQRVVNACEGGGTPRSSLGTCPMELSEATLRAILERRAVGPRWPYDRGSEEDINAHLKEVVADLQRSPRLEVATHRDHYGSGYASYVHVFCFKRKGKAASRTEGSTQVSGIDVYLCRLAPIAALGPGSQTRFAGGALSFSTLSAEKVGQAPPGDWTWELNEIQTKLARYGFDVPPRAELSKKPPGEFRAKRYRPSYQPACVFDAIFYHDE